MPRVDVRFARRNFHGMPKCLTLQAITSIKKQRLLSIKNEYFPFL